MGGTIEIPSGAFKAPEVYKDIEYTEYPRSTFWLEILRQSLAKEKEKTKKRKQKQQDSGAASAAPEEETLP